MRLDKYWFMRLALHFYLFEFSFSMLIDLFFIGRMKRAIQFSLQMMQIFLWLRGSSSEEKGGSCSLFDWRSRFSANILLLKEVLLRNLFFLFFWFSFCNKLWFCEFVPVSIFRWFWLGLFFFWTFILVL